MEQSKFYTYEVTDRTYPRCNVCGAVIADLGQHTAWHLLLSADHPDPDEVMQEDS